jgi:aromatic-L-amino-acid/L-tryptophan decarboxylase
MDSPLAVVAHRLADWPRRVRDVATTPRLSRSEILRRLARYDFTHPCTLQDVVGDMADLLEGGTLHSTHPRYFGLFNPGVRAAGVVADALAALYNPQVGAWWHAPAAAEVERHTLGYFQRRIGFGGPETSASFTTGGSEANLTGVLAGLARAFPEFVTRGLQAIGRHPVFYGSDQAHDSFVKIASVTGLGREAFRRVVSDARRRMDVGALRQAIARDRADGHAPFLVIGTAGTTATGAIDPLPQLAALCATEDLWFHVDAAWGGLAVLSDTLPGCVAGIERGDSITLDAHKVLPVPMGAGMFFSRGGAPADTVFAAHTGYVPDPEQGTRDAYQHTLQWSRRFIGLKVFVTLAELGEAGVAALVEHQIAMANLLRVELARAGWRIINDTPLPLVCFTRDGLPPAAAAAIARAVAAGGAAWVSELRLINGTHALRACITHHETGPEDIRALIDALARAAASTPA